LRKRTERVIDFVATQRHFIEHLVPIYCALGEEAGCFYVSEDVAEFAFSQLRDQGVVELLPRKDYGARSPLTLVAKTAPHMGLYVPESDRPIVTAAISDVGRCRLRERIALVEHGCGMSFTEPIASHPGGHGVRDRVTLFLMPNEISAARDRDAHPDATVVVTGCAKLDKWANRTFNRNRNNPTVALVWHWNAQTCPETGSTWDEYEYVVPDVVKRFGRGRVIGHCHPRAWAEMLPKFINHGLEPVQDFDNVIERADVLCGDGGSAPYEFAAITNKPVALRNGTQYRRHVNHGIRFWQHIPGVEVNNPDLLVRAIELALIDAKPQQIQRREAVKAVYGRLDGLASVRAAQAILNTWVYDEQIS